MSSGNPAPNPALSPREKDVLRLIALGHTSKEIASVLGISFKTVVTHRYHLASKAGTANIALLTRLAIRQGIIEP